MIIKVADASHYFICGQPSKMKYNSMVQTFSIWKLPIMRAVLAVKKSNQDFFYQAMFLNKLFQNQTLKIKISIIWELAFNPFEKKLKFPNLSFERLDSFVKVLLINFISPNLKPYNQLFFHNTHGGKGADTRNMVL